MSTGQRTELLDTIGELSRRYPDWRVGQLIANVADWADRNVWDIEDEEIIAATRQHLAQADSPEQTCSRSAAGA